MKALVIEESLKAVYREVPTPVAEGDMVLCKVAYSGICGTDMDIYSGETNFVKEGLIKYPTRIGHEWAGYVAAVGDKVTRFKVGDHVTSDPGVTCGVCENCVNGHWQKCKNIKSVGTVNCWDGSFAEYVIFPERHLNKLSDDISLRNAATIEPMTVAYAALDGLTVTEDTTVAVIGTGAIGMSAILLAKQLGAGKVVAVGRSKNKLDFALNMGADDVVYNDKPDYLEKFYALNGNKGADIVVEASGSFETVPQAFALAEKGGTVAMISFYENGTGNVDMNKIVEKELIVKGVMGKFGLVKKVADFMAERNFSGESMITSDITFDEVADCFKNYKNVRKNNIKVMVKF